MTRFQTACAACLATLCLSASADPLPNQVDVSGIDGIATSWFISNGDTFEAVLASDGVSVDRFDAFDGHHGLAVDNTFISDADSDFGVTTNASGTFIEYDTVDTGTGYSVDLEWAFLEGFGAFRMFATITRTGAGAASVDVRRFHNMGSDGSGTIIASGDGDAVAEPTDGWFATDDTSPNGGDPAIIYSLSSGAGTPPIAVTNGGPTSNNWTDQYSLTLESGESASLLWFTQLFADTTDAQAYAPNWNTIGAGSPLLVGLSVGELLSVVNHVVPEPTSLALLGFGAVAIGSRVRTS